MKGQSYVYDLVIIGAGVSGLYCANRLLQFYPKMKILVIERSYKVGGRLLSLPIPHSDIAAELGGMRIFLEVEPYIKKLVEATRVKLIDVPYIVPENLIFVQGYRTSLAELPSKSGKIYNLPPDERGYLPSALIKRSLEMGGLTSDMTSKEIDDDPYFATNNFKKVVTDNLSFQGFEYFLDCSGYRFYELDVSASTMINEDFQLQRNFDQPQYFVKNGFAEIPYRLNNWLQEKETPVWLSTMVSKFEIGKSGLIKISYCNIIPVDTEYGLLTIDCQNKSTCQLKCKKLFITAPPVSLPPLYNWPSKVKVALDSLVPCEAVKIFIHFKEPWWKALGYKSGRSPTDLPMKQVWYWTNDPAVMLIYCDTSDAEYWRPLLPSLPISQWVKPKCYPRLVFELKKQLMRMYGIPEKILNIKKLLWKRWPEAYYFWRPDFQASVENFIHRPLGENVNVYLAGDSFDSNQGWVDGAIQSTDNVLTQYFNVPSLLKVGLSK